MIPSDSSRSVHDRIVQAAIGRIDPGEFATVRTESEWYGQWVSRTIAPACKVWTAEFRAWSMPCESKYWPALLVLVIHLRLGSVGGT